MVVVQHCQYSTPARLPRPLVARPTAARSSPVRVVAERRHRSRASASVFMSSSCEPASRSMWDPMRRRMSRLSGRISSLSRRPPNPCFPESLLEPQGDQPWLVLMTRRCLRANPRLFAQQGRRSSGERDRHQT